MKKILIISATSFTNYDLSNKICQILNNLNVSSEIINLENYKLPLFIASEYKKMKKENFDIINNLTNKFIESSGLIICSPEYNGSIPPIITNIIAWISVSTDHWRDAFNDKISLITSSSGGPATKYNIAMKNQLEHLGSIVIPRSVNISSSDSFDEDSTKKILKQLIKLL